MMYFYENIQKSKMADGIQLGSTALLYKPYSIFYGMIMFLFNQIIRNNFIIDEFMFTLIF